jgi:glycosyltransferase involved in cell wall biosynthesis
VYVTGHGAARPAIPALRSSDRRKKESLSIFSSYNIFRKDGERAGAPCYVSSRRPATVLDVDGRQGGRALSEATASDMEPSMTIERHSIPRLSVAAPCYNEAAGLREFHRRMTQACMAAVGESYEIVLVDDGSQDATWTEIEGLAAIDRHVIAIRLARNYGHQIALTAGLQNCAGERVLIIDADLQDPPELLLEMMRKMDEGADVIFGQRRRRRGETRFKTLTAAVFYRVLQRLVDIEIPVDAGDFRLMTRRAINVLNGMPEQYRFIRGMVSWIGLRQVPLLYDRDPRFAGETGYSLSKMVRFALDAVTGFSVLPLRLASYLGLIMGIVSLAMLTYALGSWAFGQVVPGWTSVTAIVLVIGSAQLFVLGIFGEYLGRLYMEAKRRPLFVIDKLCTSATAEDWTEAPAANPAWQVARAPAAESSGRSPFDRAARVTVGSEALTWKSSDP